MKDKPTDAKLVVLAFCGMELFDANDWATDLDLTAIPLGFLETLGMQNFMYTLET